ncbi:hypothetical protein BC833DRAFT_98921 [Globomyces pollinis-pini]|nr:hypothetical protein BC833DRAFT_98921 [Globomyces pollinis-pini]
MNDYHHEFNEIKLESSLLKRKINYTTKSNELNHQTLAIEKYKKSSLLSMTKLNELNTKTFKLNQFNIFQKHQKG